jgi:RimJ/RimL family protein N-acetyltransferase
MPTEGVGAVRRVDRHAELLGLTGHDPYVRWGVPDPLPAPALLVSGAVAVERQGRRHGFWVWPLESAADPAAAVRSALSELLAGGHLDRPEVAGLSIAQPHVGAAAGLVELTDGGDWEWMWTTTAPPREPGEEDLVELSDSSDAPEIADMIARHNPRAWTEPGTGRTELWLGLRDESGELVVVGGMERLDTGVPHLAGILTATGLRGRGLGRMVSAALTRRALEASAVCTLGMYSDNGAARALYRRLGYRTAKAWSSRRLVRP